MADPTPAGGSVRWEPWFTAEYRANDDGDIRLRRRGAPETGVASVDAFRDRGSVYVLNRADAVALRDALTAALHEAAMADVEARKDEAHTAALCIAPKAAWTWGGGAWRVDTGPAECSVFPRRTTKHGFDVRVYVESAKKWTTIVWMDRPAWEGAREGDRLRRSMVRYVRDAGDSMSPHVQERVENTRGLLMAMWPDVLPRSPA